MVVGLSDGDDEDSKHEKDLDKVAKERKKLNLSMTTVQAKLRTCRAFTFKSLVEKEDETKKLEKGQWKVGQSVMCLPIILFGHSHLQKTARNTLLRSITNYSK